MPRQVDGNGRVYRDVYRVVVSEAGPTEWDAIPQTMKREFSRHLPSLGLPNALHPSIPASFSDITVPTLRCSLYLSLSLSLVDVWQNLPNKFSVPRRMGIFSKQ
jgi:hypothetical protein